MNMVTHLKPSNKKVIRKHIDDLIRIRTEELAVFDRNISKPLRDLIKMMKEVKQGRLPIEAMLHRSEAVSKHLQDFLNAIPNHKEEPA